MPKFRFDDKEDDIEVEPKEYVRETQITYSINPAANPNNWKNKIANNINGKPLLMIHRFKKEYMKLNLNDYILVFDDGLYNHYLWFKKIRVKFPDIMMVFAISTGIICPDYEIQDDMESPEAHELWFKHKSKIGFMNMTQIAEISMTKNCFIGVHGHNHINLVEARKSGLKQFVKTVCDDYNEMFAIALNFMHTGIIRHKIMFVLPYNQYDELALGLIRNIYNKFDIDPGLIVMGPGRLNIENL